MVPDWTTNLVYLARMLEINHCELLRQLRSILTRHGVEVRLLDDVRDIWVRDFSPIPVAPGQLMQFRYEPDYLKDHPELRTGREVPGQFADLGDCQHSNINLDGGNVVASVNKAILTDKIYRENPDWERNELRKELRRALQVEKLIIIPKEPYDYVGHADGIVRWIDEDTLLVNDYRLTDPVFSERLNQILDRNKIHYELFPYFVEKANRYEIPSALGCYINFLRTQNVVIVPAFGSEMDALAQEQLQSLLPDVLVISLDCTNLAREGGVLNCITSTFPLQSPSQKP